MDIITPELAKNARKELEMSQSAAASGIGMNRSYLSQYENGKIILSDSELDSIKEYYEVEGYVFDDGLESSDEGTSHGSDASIYDSLPSVRAIDGIQVAPAISDAEAEKLLTEFNDNEVKIKQLCLYDVRENHTVEPWFDESYIKAEPLNERINEVLPLMAKNYTIIKRLHGYQICPTCSEVGESTSTTGDFIGVLLGRLNNDGQALVNDEGNWF